MIALCYGRRGSTQGLLACQSIQDVLTDLGFASALRKVQEEQSKALVDKGVHDFFCAVCSTDSAIWIWLLWIYYCCHIIWYWHCSIYIYILTLLNIWSVFFPLPFLPYVSKKKKKKTFQVSRPWLHASRVKWKAVRKTTQPCWFYDQLSHKLENS